MEEGGLINGGTAGRAVSLQTIILNFPSNVLRYAWMYLLLGLSVADEGIDANHLFAERNGRYEVRLNYNLFLRNFPSLWEIEDMIMGEL